MSKPTHASVTDQPCMCKYLQTAAEDADNPIVFDEKTSEYQFTYHEAGLDGPSMLVIYHCPFCGGAAPESKRSLLFATISRSEEKRLAELLAPLKTIDEAVALFGKPDYDGHSRVRDPGSDERAPSVECHREIRYENLSDVASVCITERPDGKLSCCLLGKPLKK